MLFPTIKGARAINKLEYQFFNDSDTGQQLYAVPDWYFGFGKWTAHLSIVNKKIIAQAQLSQIANIFENIDQANNNLVNNISMGNGFEKLTMSYSFGTAKNPQEILADIILSQQFQQQQLPHQQPQQQKPQQQQAPQAPQAQQQLQQQLQQQQQQQQQQQNSLERKLALERNILGISKRNQKEMYVYISKNLK